MLECLLVVPYSSLRHRPGRAALVAAIIGVAALLGFLVVLSLVLSGETVPADGDFLVALHNALVQAGIVGSAVGVFLVITTLAGGWGVTVLVVAVVALCAAQRRFGLAAMLAASAIGGALLNDVIKPLTARPRPTLFPGLAPAHGYAFPSEHAVSAVTCVAFSLLVLALLVRARPLRAALLVAAPILVFLIDLSRLVLAVHWPSDVIAGNLLGLSWAAIVLATGLAVAEHRAADAAALERPAGPGSRTG
jgi:undecaprenyl-diphosphatase